MDSSLLECFICFGKLRNKRVLFCSKDRIHRLNSSLLGSCNLSQNQIFPFSNLEQQWNVKQPTSKREKVILTNGWSALGRAVANVSTVSSKDLLKKFKRQNISVLFPQDLCCVWMYRRRQSGSAQVFQTFSSNFQSKNLYFRVWTLKPFFLCTKL